MDLNDTARELFECLMSRVYNPSFEPEGQLSDKERAAIEAYLDLEGEQDDSTAG